MCAISAVSDYGRENLYLGIGEWKDYKYPNTITNKPSLKTELGFDGYKTYMELLRKAAEYDRIMNEPNCHDPEKMKFLNALVERMNKLGEEFVEIGKEIKKIVDHSDEKAI